MLWSIIPEDTVFAGMGLYGSGGQQAMGDSLHNGGRLRMDLGGCPCEVIQGGDGGLRVAAVCSTNPKDFMRKNIQPGQRILLLK